MKKNNSKVLDQFYTKDEVAFFCVGEMLDFLSTNKYEVAKKKFLEPSAGDGAFLRALEKKGFCEYFAYDIDPKSKNIKKQDFLNERLAIEVQKNKVLTIGNPPFGKRSRLAVDFINRAFEYSNTVAFILPLQFQKYSAQSQIDNTARLIFDKKLDADSFVFGGKTYSVRCCFQIWTTENIGRDLRIRKAPATKHKDFEMWQYNNTREAEKYFNKEKYQWDFAIPRQGYKNYKIRETDPDRMDHHTQWIFFKANDEKTLMRLMDLDYEKLSRKNISIPGFGKADVIHEYETIYG